MRQARKKHPDAVVVTYVNSTAAVKAESDVCCTSANAARVVESISPDRPILFLPDRYLGTFVGRKTGRRVIPWPGFCPTHRRIRPEHIERARAEHPQAKVVVHPECLEQVAAMADEVLSTGQMIRFVGQDPAREFVVGTELGILHRMRKENPDKVFIPATEQAICPNMKWTSLESVAEALETNSHVVTVSEKTAARARRALERMLEVS